MTQITLTFEYATPSELASLYRLAANYAEGGMEKVLTMLEKDIQGKSAKKERVDSSTHWNLYQEVFNHCTCDSCYSSFRRTDRIPWTVRSGQVGDLTAVRKDTGDRHVLCSSLSKRVLAYFRNSKVFKNYVIGYIFHPLPDIKELKKEKFFQDNRSKQIANQATMLTEKQKMTDRFIKSSDKTLALLNEELEPMETRLTEVEQEIFDKENEMEELEKERAAAHKMQVHLEKQAQEERKNFCNINELVNGKASKRPVARSFPDEYNNHGDACDGTDFKLIKQEHQRFVRHFELVARNSTDQLYAVEPEVEALKEEELELQSKIEKLVHEVEEIKNQQKHYVKASITPANDKVTVLSIKHN